MLLGAARLLHDRRRAFPGRVILMFQPARKGSAARLSMLDEGVLEAAVPSGGAVATGAFSIHISARYPTARSISSPAR